LQTQKRPHSDRGLGGRVSRTKKAPAFPEDGRDVDDPPAAALFDHDAGGGTGTEKGSPGHDPDRQIKDRRIHLQGRLEEAHPRIVHQNVQPAEGHRGHLPAPMPAGHDDDDL